jgi:hypothetical protein
VDTNPPGGSYTPPDRDVNGSSPAPAGEELIHPSNPPRDPIIVLILNLLIFGGAGYIVMGQKVKGIVAIVLWCLFLVPPSCGTLSGLIALLTAIDGFLQATQLREGKPIGQWTVFSNHR